MEPYAASLAWYRWYEAFVGDIPFDEGVDQVHALVDCERIS